MLCECGCGMETNLAWRTERARGWVKGKPLRFRRGHQNRGKKLPPRAVHSTDYHTIHQWLNRHFTKTGTCEECGSSEKRTVWAFLHHPAQYTRERADYRELCDRCHILGDLGVEHYRRISKMGLEARWGKRA